MGKRIVEVLIDDLTGEESDKVETITFGLDGASYEIELAPKNADKFRGLFQDYIAAGRRTSSTRRGAGRKPAADGPSAKEVKAWADQQGLDYPQRGRLPKELVDQYLAAN